MSQASAHASTSVYQTCDPAYLRQLREQAEMDLAVLAKTACLSLAQVRELEQGTETGVFYSMSIRRQAYKRLLMILGAEPPTVEPGDVPLPDRQEHQAQLQNLDQIAAMSRLPSMGQSPWVPVLLLAQRVVQHKQVLAAGVFLVFSAALLVGNWPKGGTATVVSSVTEAASAATAAASESAAAVGAVLTQPATAVAAPAPSLVASVAAKPVASAAVAASAPSKPASVPVASAPVVTASAAAPTVVSAHCAYSAEALPQVSPMQASKPGRYVHFVSTANVELCVVDGNKQATVVNLKAGESRSVYGTPPWQVSSANWGKVQIFFQGWRVSTPNEASQRMTLVEKSITP